jgi:hypothetical protein
MHFRIMSTLVNEKQPKTEETVNEKGKTQVEMDREEYHHVLMQCQALGCDATLFMPERLRYRPELAMPPANKKIK